MEGFQLWLNLPARDKMCAPGYRDIPTGEIPEARAPGVTVRVIAGQALGVAGAMQREATAPTYLDLHLEPGATFAVSVVAEPTVTTAPVDGAVSAAVGRELPAVAATAADVIVLPNESSATAVSVYAPATAGVHATV